MNEQAQVVFYAAAGAMAVLLAVLWATRRQRSCLPEAPVSQQWLAEYKRREDPE
jgi:hypothetical protein